MKKPSKTVQKIAESLAFGFASLSEEELFRYRASCQETADQTTPSLTAQVNRYKRYVQAANLAISIQCLTTS